MIKNMFALIGLWFVVAQTQKLVEKMRQQYGEEE